MCLGLILPPTGRVGAVAGAQLYIYPYSSIAEYPLKFYLMYVIAINIVCLLLRHVQLISILK